MASNGGVSLLRQSLDANDAPVRVQGFFPPSV